MEGKRTVLVALALDGAPAEDAALLDRSLGTRLDEPLLTELRRVIVDSGAHAQVEQVIDALVARSTGALAVAPVDGRARTVLGELAAAATDRSV